MHQHELESVRNKFKSLVEQCDDFTHASDIIKSHTYGIGIDRSTVSRIYKGEGKSGVISMATRILELHFERECNTQKK